MLFFFFFFNILCFWSFFRTPEANSVSDFFPLKDSDILQKAVKMALRYILSVNSHLTGFKLSPGPTMALVTDTVKDLLMATDIVMMWSIFSIQTQTSSKSVFLIRPWNLDFENGQISSPVIGWWHCKPWWHNFWQMTLLSRNICIVLDFYFSLIWKSARKFSITSYRNKIIT